MLSISEPPKQKRKKTLELFDDNEDSLFGAKETSPVTAKPTPTANKSAAGQAETANETAKATDGLFSGDDSKLNPGELKFMHMVSHKRYSTFVFCLFVFFVFNLL